MSRNNYDDMPTRYERQPKQGRKTGLVAILGVIITLFIIVFYLIVSPVEESDSQLEKTVDEATSLIAKPEVEKEDNPTDLTVPPITEMTAPELTEEKEVVEIVLADIVPITPTYEEENPEPEKPLEEASEPETLEPELPLDSESEQESTDLIEEIDEEITLDSEEPLLEEPSLVEDEVLVEPPQEEIAVEENPVPEEEMELEILEEVIQEEPHIEEMVPEEPLIEEMVSEEPLVEEIVFEEDEVEIMAIVEEEPVKVEIPLSIIPIDNELLTMSAYVVQESDTLNSIAKAHKLEPSTIISVNSLSNIDSISSGDILFIPNIDGKLYVFKADDSVDILYSRFNPGCSKEDFIKMNLLDARELEEGMSIFLPKSYSKGELGYKPAFSIPIEGEITMSFGETYEGQVLNGVIIKGYSTKVISPLSGKVEYAGKNSRNGKYVILSHSDGYTTAYYGLETVDVKKGMEIKQGDTLGSLSANGIFGRFCILFIVEQNGIAIDPAFFI